MTAARRSSWRLAPPLRYPHTMSPRLLLASLLLLLPACASSEEPPPEAAPADAAPAPEAEVAPRRNDHVLFSVTKADLATQVLPLFEQQVGVVVRWQGEPRALTLRLSQPVHWEEALSLVCQFTRTHPTRDYQGRILLKDGWGGDLGDGDMGALTGQPSSAGDGGRAAGAGARRTGGGGASAPGWDDGNRPAPSAAGGIPQPTGAYSGGAEANRILKGAGTRTSPPR